MNVLNILVHKPVLAKIAYNLNFISRLSLLRTFPQLRGKIPKLFDFRQVVRAELVKLLNSEKAADAILNGLQETQTWLSGSIVLKCLTGLDFDIGDIDFFTNNYGPITRSYKFDVKSYLYERKNVSRFSYWLYCAHILDTRYSCVRQDKTVVRNAPQISGFERQHRQAMLNVTNFYCNEIKLQSIVIDKEYPVDSYIDEVFDMSFLKNMFNGKTLRILDPEAVLKQSATVNLFHAYFKSFRHISLSVYCGLNTTHTGQEHFIKRQCDRLNKYRKRGFHVSVSYDQDIERVKKLCKRWDTSYNLDFDIALRKWNEVVHKMGESSDHCGSKCK